MALLIDRLRAADEYFCGRDHEVFADAADEIERLRKLLRDLVGQGEEPGVVHCQGDIWTFPEVIAARAALEDE